MSEISLILVCNSKTRDFINDMTKVQIKSEKITPFGEIFHVREFFHVLRVRLSTKSRAFNVRHSDGQWQNGHGNPCTRTVLDAHHSDGQGSGLSTSTPTTPHSNCQDGSVQKNDLVENVNSLTPVKIVKHLGVLIVNSLNLHCNFTEFAL